MISLTSKRVSKFAQRSYYLVKSQYFATSSLYNGYTAKLQINGTRSTVTPVNRQWRFHNIIIENCYVSSGFFIFFNLVLMEIGIHYQCLELKPSLPSTFEHLYSMNINAIQNGNNILPYIRLTVFFDYPSRCRSGA